MGGHNSGCWSRVKDRRTTLNQVFRLDVRTLHREGYLQPWQHGILRWFEHGRCVGEVAYTMTADVLVLSYDTMESGEAWQPSTSTFTLDWTACHYGGKRPWFLCPQCARRVAILATVGQRWLCRHCARLPYASQCETPIDRGYRKVRKLRDKVVASHNLMQHIGDKPRGMQWRTFWKICEQEHTAHMQVLRRLTAALPPGWR